MAQRDYDSTVARIAGNLLSGHSFSFSGDDAEKVLADGGYQLDAWDRVWVSAAVALAREIVAETKRSQPAKESPC